MSVLGLDIGPNSIGWALIDEHQLIDVGVRVFPEGVDNFDTSKELSRNEDRRVARGMRRQVTRRKRRKLILRRALVSAGLLPADPAAMRAVLEIDPYELRRRALKEKLTPHELGRIILHLNRRRGFLSNSKKDKGDKELKGMLAEISELAKEMGDATLGEHLAKLHADPHARIRGKHTMRKMIFDEFDRVWTAQAKHHPALLTDMLRYGKSGPQKHPHLPRRLPKNGDWLSEFGVEGIVFFQRPMYWPASMVGLCEFEKGERRCAKADRAFQRFRMLQEVNNLRYIDPDKHAEQSLTTEQRELLLDKLSKTEKLTFDQIRKALGFLDTIRFSLEKSERSKLDGHKTDVLLARAAGKSWHARPEKEKDQIVRILMDPKLDDDAIQAKLTSELKLPEAQAADLATVDLPAGYGSVSLKAINKLLPFLEQGMRYMAESDPAQSALHAAGYLRADEMKKRLFDELPSLEFIRSGPLADLANPVVVAALYQVRKVANAIVRTHGRPDHIHIEMARSLKMNEEKRKEYNSANREREQERSAAADYLREKHVKLSREAIIRYQLWQQQSEKCVYSGKSISFAQLFGGEVDIDHVLPYKRTLDDSQGNKVVCFRKFNSEKDDRTPYEWLADADPKRYEELCQRARPLSYGKYRKFLQKELELDDFIERQLRDTAYIARLACEYLKLLVEKDHQVLGLKGQHTSELRHQWGLDTILEKDLPDSPAWQEDQAGKVRPGEKNRADHRHHAIDAIVVALTDRSRLQQLSRIHKEGGTRTTGEVLPEPWDHFRASIVAKVKDIKVSHRVQRKVAGKLHEETVYGPTKDIRGNVVPGQFVVRKAVENLSPNEIELIRDPAIRKIVADAAAGAGLKTGRSKKGSEKDADASKKIKTALANLRMPGPKGPPIKKVRLLRSEKTIQPIRMKQAEASGDPTQIAYVKPGSTHHLCIFEWQEKGKRVRDAVFVTMLEAARRIRQQSEFVAEAAEQFKGKGLSKKQLRDQLKAAAREAAAKYPVIIRTHADRPDAKFVMSLSAGEIILADWKGEQKLLAFKTAASTQGQIYFCEHTDARRSADYKKYVCNCNTLEGRKVTIDPLGRIRWAND